MAVYQKHKKRGSKIYHYQFEIDGVRFYGSTREEKKAAAKAEEQRIIREIKENKKRKPDITLNAASERYLIEVMTGKASYSTTDYHLENLNRIIGSHLTLADISQTGALSKFQSIRRGEKNRNAPKSHKPSCRCAKCSISPASVNREIQILRRMYRRAQNIWRVNIGEMPNWSDYLYPEPEERVRVLSVEEEERLFAALRPDWWPLFMFWILSGVRKADALTLKWSKVDMDAGVIYFKTKSRKPNGKPHVVPITKAIRSILENEKGHNPIFVFTYVCQRNHAGRRRKGDRYPFSYNGWKRTWQKALANADIDNFTIHDLRHTAATRLLRKTGNLVAAQKLLGHSDIQTTTKYAHVLVDDLREMMEDTPPNSLPIPITEKKLVR